MNMNDIPLIMNPIWPILAPFGRHGVQGTLQHLDGRTIYFGHTGVTNPFAVMKISKEGMPHKDPTEKGDLYIKCTLENSWMNFAS